MLPPILISSAGEDASTSPPAHQWKNAGARQWALRISPVHSAGPLAAKDPRWPSVVELDCEDPELVSSPLLTQLARATANGKALSTLASRPGPCPLEIAFPRTVPNWVDGSMVQVFPPLTKGIWRAALAVGALTRLRGVAFDACETDKQRATRGDKPYVVGPPWFWSSPLAQQLEAVSIAADPHPLVTWRARFDALSKLTRVYLRVWCRDRQRPSPRALRVVIERADHGRLNLTLQCAVSIRTLDLAMLFAGARDDVAAIDIEQLVGDVTDDAGTLGELLGTDVRALRGHARLGEL